MAIFIIDCDVEKLLPMKDAIDAVELALGELHRG